MKPGNFSFQQNNKPFKHIDKPANTQRVKQQTATEMDTTGSHIKVSERRKAKRNFRPKAASMFGLDGDAPYSLGNTMSTQKVPHGAIKNVGSG